MKIECEAGECHFLLFQLCVRVVLPFSTLRSFCPSAQRSLSYHQGICFGCYECGIWLTMNSTDAKSIGKEINFLKKYTHPNVVHFLSAYYYNDEIWV